jgi:hypothetical protein
LLNLRKLAAQHGNLILKVLQALTQNVGLRRHLLVAGVESLGVTKVN